jgi:DNA-binding FadR family transcriptional regulator
MSDKNENAMPLYRRICDFMRSRTNQDLSVRTVPSEAALSSRFGAARPQVREALAVLEAVGAVQSRRGAARTWIGSDAKCIGRLVALTSDHPETSLSQLLDIRHSLEVSFLPHAAVSLREHDIERLRSLGDEMVLRCAEGEHFSDLDSQFHLGLFAHLGNDMLNGILASFWDLFALAEQEDSSVEEDPEIAAMHGQIIDAIVQGDIKLALYKMDTHFYGIRQRLTMPANQPIPNL